MRVVGINAFHDASVAVINDGKLEAFFKEERYTRKKRDGVPYRSLVEMLTQNLDIDFVAISAPSFNGDPQLIPITRFCTKVITKPVFFFNDDHHLCHASLAFYNSGYSDALVFVVDRSGSEYKKVMREAETVFHCSYPDNFKVLHKNYWVFNKGDADVETLKVAADLQKSEHSVEASNNMSIVRVYESATSLIKQDPLENGKTMGLAAYGFDKPFEKFFENGLPRDDLFINGHFSVDSMTTTLFKKYYGKETADVNPSNYQFYADYAFQVQKQTQERLFEMVQEWVNKTGITRVCITGGYGLNVVANEYLIKKLPHVQFYFEPLADDTGNSIGAAMYLYRNLTHDTKINKIETTFTHGHGDPIQKIGNSCSVGDIVSFLEQQKTVAVFNGKAESGPRALGNRSILFDARNTDAKDIVNRIKKREWYRPFAGMILVDSFTEYFDTHGIDKSEFMTVSFQCRKPSSVPGVVHVDNSCRVQTVDGNIPHMFELLTEFKNRTGCPVLLNTSFNLAGDPLVETQEEAIETFMNSELDVLWFPETQTCMVK